MRYVLIIILALGIFAGTAQAGSNQNLCAKNYPNLQSESGGTFSSVAECAMYAGKGGTLYQPRVSLTPTAAGWYYFYVTATGFHPSTTLTLTIAVNGTITFSSSNIPSDASGSYPSGFLWDCYPNWPSPVQLTFTFVDSFGVHASAHITLC